jgi:hypothetical protein
VLEKNLNAFHDIFHNQMPHRENYFQVYMNKIKTNIIQFVFIYFKAASKYCLDSLTTSVAINIQPFKLKAYEKR